jgi:short-subunit dehydrogenase
MSLPAPSEDGTALVTGASSGIGEAIARELARRGYALTLVARREDRLKALAKDLSEEHGVEAETARADLGNAGERDRLATAVRKGGKRVDILVNNAGFGAHGDFTRVERERLTEMVRVNCEAVVDLTGHFLPAMVDRGVGAVINIASVASFQPLPGSATYAATKAFVLSFSEAIRTEVRGNGVTVTAVCPGPVRTEFPEAAGMGGVEDRTPGIVWMSAEQVAREAVGGADRGKRVVVPGSLNRAQSLLGHHTPRSVALPLINRIWKNV